MHGQGVQGLMETTRSANFHIFITADDYFFPLSKTLANLQPNSRRRRNRKREEVGDSLVLIVTRRNQPRHTGKHTPRRAASVCSEPKHVAARARTA